jgi:hypothetical protein
MTKSVGNETIEKYWCFLSRNWHWLDILTWNHIKKNMSVKWTFDGKFQICQISLLPTDSDIPDHAVYYYMSK